MKHDRQHYTVVVPQLSAYTPHTGIGRVFHSLHAEWGTRVTCCDAPLLASRWPLLRNFPHSVLPPSDADLVLLPKLTGAQALRNTHGKPSVVIVHDVGVVDCPEDRHGMDWLTRQSVLQSLRAVRFATHIVTDSEFTRQRLLAYVPHVADRTVVIHPGVGFVFLEHNRSLDAARAVLQAHVSAPLGSPLLIYVGSELPRKNIALLLRVLQHLKQRHPHAQLLKVGRAGDARWRAQTLHCMAELGLQRNKDVVFVEDMDDAMLADAYRAANVFVSPSLYEGFGLPALEAMAVGTPVVVSNQGSFPEVVGSVGRVVDPTVEACVQAIEAMLGCHNDAAHIQHSRNAAAGWTWTRAAHHYLDLFAACVEAQRMQSGASVRVPA